MMRPRVIGAAMLVAVVPLFFVDLESLGVYAPPELHAVAHVAVFALLAYLLMGVSVLRSLPFARRGLAVVVLVVVVSVVVELIQPYLGRSASVRDVAQNLVGASAGIALAAPVARQRALLGAIAGVLVVLALAMPVLGLWDRAVARSQFPVLGDFETRFEHRRWSSGAPDGTVARSGARSLRIELSPGRYAGTTLRRSFGDWREYTHLDMSLFNPDTEPLTFSVSIRDGEHFRRGGHYPDRYNGRFVISPGWNDLRIPVEQIRTAPQGRELDLSDVAEMVIFTANLTQPRVIHLDRVKLTRNGPL